MDMAEQGDIEHTLVMSDTSGTETGSKSGSLRSDIVIEGSHKTIETVDLNADSSLEFRRYSNFRKNGMKSVIFGSSWRNGETGYPPAFTPC